MSFWPITKITDALANIINPAKEDGNLATAVANQTNGTQKVIANAGTNLNTSTLATALASVLALESGGNLASLAGKDFATQTTLALIKAVTDKFTFDLISKDLVENDHVHNEIHAGNNYYFSDAISLGSSGAQDYLFTTANSAVLAHFVFYVDFLFVTQIQIFEGSDKTGTTAQTIFNRNRSSANASIMSIKKGTSGGTTDGTQIFNYQSGVATGTGSNKITGGGSLTGRNELDLKANTKYIIRVTSSTAANLINVLFDWYEE